MNPVFESNYELRYFEMNKNGMASPTTMLTLLEETAAEHCLSIGHSLYSLEKQNIGWVLASGIVEMIRYPGYKENITIKTWLSSYTLVRGYRENIILDSEENIIGRAKGLWVFYDIKKRKPLPIFDDIRLKWGRKEESSVEKNLGLVNQSEDGPFRTEFNVYNSDVDSNEHVNNIRYLHYLMESLPEDFMERYHLKVLNAKFIAEARLGEKIKVYVNEDMGDNNLFHTMKNSSGDTVLAKAHTQWEEIS